MPTQSGTLQTLARHLVLALAPLKDAVESLEAFRTFLYRLGWSVTSLPPEYTALAAKMDAALTALDGLDDDPAKAFAAFDKVKALYTALTGVATAPAGVDPAAFLADIGRSVFDLLLVDYLAAAFPQVHATLEALNVITQRYLEETDDRPGILVSRFQWEEIPKLLADPGSVPTRVYGWGTDDLDLPRLAGHLLNLFVALDWPAYIGRVDRDLARGFKDVPDDASTSIDWGLKLPVVMDNIGGKEIEVGLALLELPPQGGKHAGLILQPLLPPEIGTSYHITDQLRLDLRADSNLASTFGVLVRPGDVSVKFPLQDGTLPQSGFGVKLGYVPDGGAVLLGDASSTRLTIQGVTTSMDLDVHQDGVEVKGGLSLDGFTLVLASKDQDGFLSSVIGQNATVPIPLALQWSSRSGIAFAGGGGLTLSQGTHLSLGPVTVQAVSLALRTSAGSGHPPDLIVEAGASLGGSLGPVAFSVADVGMQLTVTFQDGNAGPFDIDVGFKPPSGIGLSIDTQGVVTGGGFLFHDAAQGLYAGVMKLSISDAFTVSAFGLIGTRMPDGSPGYSLIVFITAEDFRPIPLGMGFTLQGIGGMVAVNRTFDQDVLRAGMQNDTLKTLLFPRDPVTNAPAIIRSLASAFPARRGSYLLGILARIGWFTPTLILLDLALILEFGARKRLLVLGRISALLPSPDNDLVRINLDAIGVLDFDQDTASIDALLVDSRLAHKFVLTGAAALRAGWGAGPHQAFVLSVGGFNPRFAPPAGVPPLARVAIALCSGNNPRLTCESYFALTANTIQFGARASLYAEACSFSIEGDISYDVLISRAPLHFIADYHASVQLKYSSHNLFKVSVDGSLEGPRPLRVSGKATFEIFWCDFSVRFDKTLIDGEPPPLPPAVDVLAELNRALATAQSWSTQAPAGRTHGVALRKLPAGTALVLDPLGRLVVVQDVVPLNTGRDIDTFGGAPVAGARRFALAATLNSVDLKDVTTTLQAPFAPAQFFAMSDDDKIASPSFAQMDAGFVVGKDDTVTIDATPANLVAAPLEYDSIVIDTLAADLPPKQPAPYRLPVARLGVHAATGAAARAPLRRVGRARFRTPGQPAVDLAAPAWAIAPLDGGPPLALAATVKTWSEYQGALAALNRAGARFQLVPARELAA